MACGAWALLWFQNGVEPPQSQNSATAWLAGEAPRVQWAAWVVEAANLDAFSPGRVRLVHDLVAALREGRVAPTP